MDDTIDDGMKKVRLGKRTRALARESQTEDVDLKTTRSRTCSENIYGKQVEEDENMTLSNFSDSSSYVFSPSPSSDISLSESSSLPSPPPRPAGGKTCGRKRKTRSGKKATYKHIPHSLKPPHLVAKRNARERKRVQAVNSAFSKLRKHVPYEPRHKRLSKVKTLRFAIDYIQHLHKMIQTHDEQIAVERTAAGMYSTFFNSHQNVANPHEQHSSDSHSFPVHNSARRRAKLRENAVSPSSIITSGSLSCAPSEISHSSDFSPIISQQISVTSNTYQPQSCSALAIAPMTPLQKYESFPQHRKTLSYTQSRDIGDSFPRHLTEMSCSFPNTPSTPATGNSIVRRCAPDLITDQTVYNEQLFSMSQNTGGGTTYSDYHHSITTDVNLQQNCSFETMSAVPAHSSGLDSLACLSDYLYRPQRQPPHNSFDPTTHQTTFYNNRRDSGSPKLHYGVFSPNILDKQLINVNFQTPKGDLHSSYEATLFKSSKTKAFEGQTVCPQ